MTRPSALLALLAALAALALAPGVAGAAQAKTSLADLEDEVMCVECGTPLEVSQSPVAQQERAFIRREIAAGKTKAQIKADLVDEYGQAVLAEPSHGGIGIAAWLVPIVLVPLAALGVALLARRWRRGNGAGETDAAPADAARAPTAPLDPDDARRLDAELAAFDR
jgi:cytochrome c-type biogenesis protein CcmH